MKKVLSGIVLCLVMLFGGAAAVAAAGLDDNALHLRIEEQQKRINDGIASGELTRSEAELLQTNLVKARAEMSRLKTDGNFTTRERRRIKRMLDYNDKQIYRKTHNAARRKTP